jgi:hypothetical protein
LAHGTAQDEAKLARLWRPTAPSIVAFKPIDVKSSGPPEASEEPPLTIEAASQLMARLGFIAFRTPPGSPVPDACLMAIIRDTPTEHHFDPELASYWVTGNGRGRIEVADRDTRTPLLRPYSWGRIRLLDRFGMRNSFVSFGGTLTAERVGADALLLVFRSAAAILRLPGHSQRQDHLADEALSFFGRLTPRLWDSPTREADVASAAPEELYAAFVVHASARLGRSRALRESLPDDATPITRELNAIALNRPAALNAGQQLLERLDLAGDR